MFAKHDAQYHPEPVVARGICGMTRWIAVGSITALAAMLFGVGISGIPVVEGYRSPDPGSWIEPFGVFILTKVGPLPILLGWMAGVFVALVFGKSHRAAKGKQVQTKESLPWSGTGSK